MFSERLRSDVNAVVTMVSEVSTCARIVMGTQGYMVPEVTRGDAATPAADAYSLGVMFVYLLTGLWYESGSKVSRVLETLEYGWNGVLLRLLAENPADRPTNLSELVASLKQVSAEEPAVGGRARTPSAPRRVWNTHPVIAFALAIVAVLVAVAVGFFVFSHRSAISATDDFDESFGVRGIYEAPEK